MKGMTGAIFVLLAVLGSLVLLGATAPDGHAQADPAQQLAERYAPIVMLKQQSAECDADGEAYIPAPVEIVFGDPQVTLVQQTDEKDTDQTITSAPTAADLGATSGETYIDLPGNPRDPRCDFERHAKERMAGLTPTTYARITVDEAREKLVLQYWFYYYFNLYTNTHESDWEMITLVWDTTSLEEALASDPALAGYAQHGNGELARWSDVKLEREGTRPIVYPAAGSHGSYFSDNTYISWGENGTGFGCDDASGPSVRVPLQPVLMPADPDPAGPFAWLTYQGRWGERNVWEFNGPKGPNLGKKWSDPIGAITDWRSSSLVVPTQDTLGPNATDTFCTISEAGSKVLMYFGVYPWLAAIVAAAAIGLPSYILVRGRHLLGASVTLYRAHRREFVPIGLLTIPIGIIFNGLTVLVSENPPLEWLIQWLDNSAGARLLVALLVFFLQQAVMLAVVGPAVIHAVADIRAGREPTPRRSYRIVFGCLVPLAAAVAMLTAATGLLTLTVIGTPIAIWLSVRWQFFGQAVILDGASNGREALGVSTAAVRGSWWRVFGGSIAFQMIGALPGPLIGLVLLIFGGTSVMFANGISSLIYTVAVPISVIGLTLMYLRLTGRELVVSESTAPARPSGTAAAPLPPAPAEGS